ncbi:Linear gramicidin synthase subunit D [Pseudoalteromonas holothuriae]|uniref:Linear gramicidin synthase subunit D n=1 Tax=Pseudoalteromonas holothuriae TaxID=2963714 RepID=A0A9W4QR54_9GAMM|nr:MULTISPECIES: thioester reductase domain-containing protein [unclassified Pseudoalteromonas]CAH9049697.1 Linear gramicidin synthase subunit D [Pseudoalteromonas sp. CIP111854]CAH9051665.1 Linear gramicidin synthase subunit D [Pseudoalteromonas sp. CIP111951]
MNNNAAFLPDNYLLTGASGVLGGRILTELLTTTSAKIYCMSREKDLDNARSRILEMVDMYDSDSKVGDQLSRISVVYGDIGKDLLGLNSDDYATLASQAQVVIHCAAKLSLIAEYPSLREENVAGTERVAKLCMEANIPLLYTSSFSVVGSKLYESGFVLKEDKVDYGQCFDDMGYEQTKFESEVMLNELSQKGLQVAIVRPGNIWGDSQNGRYPLSGTTVKGIYYEMIRALVETGYTFHSTDDFDITPVDYVAKASLAVVKNIHTVQGQTFNLVNPNPPTYNAIVDLLREYGYEVRNVPCDDYFQALHEDRMLLNGKPYHSSFTDILALVSDEDDLSEQAKYDTSRIQALLKETDIRCPKLDIKLMTTLLDHCVASGLIKSPADQHPLAEISEEITAKVFMEHLYDA